MTAPCTDMYLVQPPAKRPERHARRLTQGAGMCSRNGGNSAGGTQACDNGTGTGTGAGGCDISSVARADVLRPVLGEIRYWLAPGLWRLARPRASAHSRKTTHVLIPCDAVAHHHKQQIQSLLDDRSVATREFHCT